MGTSDYKGGASYHHEVSENISRTGATYGYNNGFFGIGARKQSDKVRRIESSNPESAAKDFYNKIGYGGIESNIPKGKKVEMEDGTIITWRNVSSSDGSPAVDINK